MKCNKKILAVAAAGALSLAAAAPALALENEFHGSFTAFYDLSNYSAVGNDAFEQFDKFGKPGSGAGSQNATGLDKQNTENFFVQRVRLNYNAKANDNVKLVTKFEMDYSFWGNSNFAVGRNKGGGIGADSVQIETKNLYLDLTYPILNARIGMQGYNDSIKGILFDDDMAGVLLSHNYSNASVSAGFFRFLDNGDIIGKNDFDMVSLDGKFDVTKNFKVGASYYYISDNRTNGATSVPSNPASPFVDGSGNPIYPAGTTFTDVANPNNRVHVHTFALNAEGNVGPVSLNGFAAVQTGARSENQLIQQNQTRVARGYALNLGAKMPVMGGTAHSEFLYVGGDKHGWYVPGTATAGTHGGAFYDGEMVLLLRDKNTKTIDVALNYDVNNYNRGLIFGMIGYEHPCTEKWTNAVNAGFAAVANSIQKTSSNYVGTELNLESNYKLNANTTIGVRGAYVILGDIFKNPATGKIDADNLYDMKIIASYAF